ncbi:MAG: methyltransferase domain-containing protein [Phormidesmis sp. CAN_BIN36]|nr:methyltransferase domain-containing protein [Phormidesmis sp. CAN_BIN36]
MFEAIVQQFRAAEYDFRSTAYSADPLAHLFTDWVDYYKLKWAIARTLKPASILEIGVRFGYSAAAFLEGHPIAHYVGIDLDNDLYGGVKGAIRWAKEITAPFKAEFIVADTQKMERFPGGFYDLIHVDGQQDGDGSFHDLELAIQQSQYVLVDGYFWTRQNFMAISDFLLRYADLIEWYGVIPGYAGELLIKVSPSYIDKRQELTSSGSSLSLQQTYTTDYYTQDCGGFDAYKEHQGKKLADPRLEAVAAISHLKPSSRVLDLGCGRGELTYYFASQGCKVTAIDYSENALALAEKCFEGEPHLYSQVEFFCADVCTIDLSDKKYDLAVASDLIEHLSFTEVSALYEKVAAHLQPDGLFIVHTFPNLWHYQYEYVRRRRVAASVGAYLPAEPRTRYELLMHINEQSPRVLKKQLSEAFENVLLWFGDPINPGGSLVQKFSKQQLRAAPSLFAVASHQALDPDKLRGRFAMAPLLSLPSNQLKLSVRSYPRMVGVNSEFEIQLDLENYSEFVLHSFGAHPVNISYHWMQEQTHNFPVFDGERTKLLPSLETSPVSIKKSSSSAGKGTYKAKIKSLTEQGSYILRVTLVQEGVCWLDQAPTYLMQDLSIKIT